MTRLKRIARATKRMLMVSLTLSMCAALSGTALARGGSGGGGEHGGEGPELHGGGHGGEGLELHGGGHHGSIVRELPRGYIEIAHGGNRYFFHEGRFFNRHRDGFIVVSAPMGALVPGLPVGALLLSVGGINYYVTDDNYFRRVPDGFVVVESPYR